MIIKIRYYKDTPYVVTNYDEVISIASKKDFDKFEVADDDLEDDPNFKEQSKIKSIILFPVVAVLRVILFLGERLCR